MVVPDVVDLMTVAELRAEVRRLRQMLNAERRAVEVLQEKLTGERPILADARLKNEPWTRTSPPAWSRRGP